MTENGKWQDMAQSLETMTVLFVDDEDHVLNSIRRVLRHEPYKVITNVSALSALEFLKSQTVQMVVSDQKMPEMAGIEFLEKVRLAAPDTIRVMLTGYSELKTAEAAINQVEIYRFLSKPWNDEELKATIIQGLTKWQLKDANRKMFAVIERQNLELQEFNRDLELKVEERTRQLKEAEARLIQSEKMATVGLLAGGVAHELNNPLGGILALAQLLMMDHQHEPQAMEDLKAIEHAVLQCKDIICSLLNFSRQSNERYLEPVNLAQVVENSMRLIGHIFRGSGITVEEHYQPELPVLMGNPNRLQQVLVNLLTNSQQAMKKGGTICIRALRRNGAGLALEVEDQGEGIPEDYRSKIFDPFFTTKEPGKGTGLGLFVTYGIVRDHGGRIEVESEPGKGTLMRLVFDGLEN
jgi:signal transduction histidine kinase